MIKNKITKEELQKLYWDKEMSTRDIAEYLNVGQTTVRRWMKNYGIEARTSKESK